MDNYNFSNSAYNFNCEMNYYNYNFYNTPPPPIQNSDPRLGYTGEVTSASYIYPEVEQSYYSDVQLKYDLSLPCQDVEVEQKTDDELYIETWLSKIGKIRINLNSTIEVIKCEKKCNKANVKSVKISAAKLALRKCLYVIKKLEDAQENLKTNFSTLSSVDWKNKTFEINNLQCEFASLMSQFQNRDSLELLKTTVNKRKNKRLNQNRKKIATRKQKMIDTENRKMLHKDMDRWLENMKDAVEKIKMKENMQKDADCVLAEVTKKKLDARKQLSLIASLIKLRNIRENMVAHQSEKVSSEDRSVFNQITEKLTNMWEDTTKVYMKEEQMLRTMLEKNATEDGKKLHTSKDERIEEQWNNLLFGPKCIPTPIYCGLTSAEKDMETFIAIRKSWDTFLIGSASDCGASKIPIGWVLPSSNPNTNWSKYLCDGL